MASWQRPAVCCLQPRNEGNLVALDATTGKLLWRYQTSGAMAASPMSFAVDGRQYIAVAAGDSIHCFALPPAP
ncbi:MAG: PQQ-binding-like beta-propeller repeat protein [Acidobacteria bacterium]|nr:PQQ-binding-like beta-propeller repeat protein [Acidobacteriota bacterium]